VIVPHGALAAPPDAFAANASLASNSRNPDHICSNAASGIPRYQVIEHLCSPCHTLDSIQC
jgi:uncharacterized protein YqkB